MTYGKEMKMTDAAILYRVSTNHQDTANQEPETERFTKARGLNVVRVYRLNDSAWKDGKGGLEYQALMRQILADAHAGHFQVLVVWALDRVIRTGAEEALRLNRRLDERGCTLMSVKEDWLNTTSEIKDVLLAFQGWQAQQESNRRSQRAKAVWEARRAAGVTVRTRGPDKGQRKLSGYHAQWEKGGKRREAHNANRAS